VNRNASTAAPGGATPDAGTKRARPGAPKLRADGASAEARRHAAAVLEVLAGARAPTEVAQQLAMSLTRSYLIESRAVQGLLAACAPRPRGRVRSPDSELAARRRECEQLRRQAARQQALLRVTERALGLAGAAAAPSAQAGAKGPRKRRRKPKARALQAAAVLQEAAAPPADHGVSP
jgi:hypothetical protein